MSSHKVFLLAEPSVDGAAVAELESLLPETVERIDSIDDARKRAASADGDVLVIVQPSAELRQAAAEAESDGRWAVLAMGDEPGDLPRSEWRPVVLQREVHAAAVRQSLAQDNRRLRGDLWTLGRRVVHDLRTPVSCIYTGAEVLRLVKPDGEEGVSYVETIGRSALEISTLLERISVVAKATIDPISPVSVDTGAAVRQALARLARQVQAAGATVELPSGWPAVLGVQSWVSVVWENLIGNAVQHGGQGVRATMSWERENGHIRFSLEDNGPGVPPNWRPHVFRPFELAAREPALPGLGLSVVRRVVNRMGGACAYEPIDPAGSRFSFSLPAAPAGD